MDEKEIREFLEIIDEQADRMGDLINNPLDMTRIEVGSLSATPAACDLGETPRGGEIGARPEWGLPGDSH